MTEQLANPTLWRTHPYYHRGYLYINKAHIIAKARLNKDGSADPDHYLSTYPVVQLLFDSFSMVSLHYSTSDFSNQLLNGCTILVGSTDGAYDYGIIRLRSFSFLVGVTEGTAAIGGVSRGTDIGEVTLVDNAYITFIEDFRVWAKNPLIDDSGIIYKDYAMGYELEDYAKYPPPIANGGYGAVRFKNTGIIPPNPGKASFSFTATSSKAVAAGATISSYYWDITDGSLLSGTVADVTIAAEFPTGFRYIHLTVEDSNGQTHTTHIPVFVAEPNTGGLYTPVYDFTVNSHTIERQGTTMSFSVNETLETTINPSLNDQAFIPGALVMYWEDESYGGTHACAGSPASNIDRLYDRAHVKFIGWHDTESMSLEATDQGLIKDMIFNCIGTAARLRQLPGFPQVVENTEGDPESWLEMPSLSISRYIWYLLHWHSTALEVSPFFYAATTGSLPGRESSQADLFSQVQELAQGTAKEFTCDKRGGLIVRDNPMIISSSDRLDISFVELARSDWGSISINRQFFPRLYLLEGSAILEGTDPTNPQVVLCASPGQAAGQGATQSTFANMLVADQDELNAWCGNKYAYENRKWLDFTLDIVKVGDAEIDPAWLLWLVMSISESDNYQEFSITDGRFLPTSVSIDHDPETGSKEVSITMELETEGTPAATIVVDQYGLTSYPATTYGTAGSIFDGNSLYLYEGIQNIAGVDSDNYLYITNDFQEGTPSWTTVNLNNAPYNIEGECWAVAIDPFSPLYTGSGTIVNCWIATSKHIYRMTDVFGVGTRTLTQQYTLQKEMFDGEMKTMILKASYIKQNWVVMATTYSDDGDYPGDYIAYTTNGVTWSSEQRLSEHWGTAWFNIPALALSNNVIGTAFCAVFTASGASWNDPTVQLKISTDFGATWSNVTPGVNGPDVNTGSYGRGGCLVFPEVNNPSDLIAYFGTLVDDGGGSPEGGLIKASGASQSDVTPSTPMVSGTRRNTNGLDISRVDPDTLLVMGVHHSNIAGTPYIFVSTNGGSTWTDITPGFKTSRAVFAGDNDSIIYICGDGNIEYSDNQGASWSNKMSGAAETIIQLIGG